MLLGSLLAHGAIAGGALLRVGVEAPVAMAEARAGLAAAAARAALQVEVAEARRALVARARAERAAGRLALGAFLLEANAIDAREEGRPFDGAEARARYSARVEALRERMAELPVPKAVPEVFADLHYYGRAGGRMAEALLEGGGACEPLSHLITAAIHDAGRPDAAWLRFYGGSNGGATHLAPIYVEGAKEIDLLAGTPAARIGERFPASDLIEVYARVHGLASPPAVKKGAARGGGERERAGGSNEDESAPSRATMAAGYPPNEARYPGTLPMYAARAVREPSDGQPAVNPVVDAFEQNTDCAFFVRMAALDPPTLAMETPGAPAGFGVEVVRDPGPTRFERTFSVIAAVELAVSRAPGDGADRLMGLACLSALYDRAATDLTLASERELARSLEEKRRKARDDGEALIRKIDWAGEGGRAALGQLGGRFAGRSWLLLMLPGGDDVLLRLVGTIAEKDNWGRVGLISALLVAPATRARAIPIVAALPKRAQIDVMHEVYHVHDHLRPWHSNYALDEGWSGEVEIARAYRVFRGVAWGLWEGARPPVEVLDRLAAGARREGLDRAWEEQLVAYYLHNALNLYRNRANLDEVVRAMSAWLEAHGYEPLRDERLTAIARGR